MAPAHGSAFSGQDRPPALLAVDVGLRCGLALFRRPGTLEWYRSAHWANRALMRRGVWGTLREVPRLEWVVLEGTGPLVRIWHRASAKRGISTMEVPAEAWRLQILRTRERRSGPEAKRTALRLARRAIAWAGGPRPTSLAHDAAEAILLGCWALWKVGWIHAPPGFRDTSLRG